MSLLADLLEKETAQVLTIAGVLHRLVPGLSSFVAIFLGFARLWAQSFTTGAGIGIFDLLGMTFRKVNPR